MRTTVDKVTDLVDAQVAHHLLRKCLDGCKVTHLLRTTDTYKNCAPLEECEEVIFEGFGDLLGCSLSASQRSQAGLPLRVGGCGIRCPVRIRPAARIAALCVYYGETAKTIGAPEQVRQPRAEWLHPVLVELQATLGPNFDPVTGWLGRMDHIRLAGPEHKQQQWWSEALGVAQTVALLDQVWSRDQARLLEQQGGLGTAFMSVTPNTNLASSFSTDSYKLGLTWWLGVTILTAP